MNNRVLLSLTVAAFCMIAGAQPVLSQGESPACIARMDRGAALITDVADTINPAFETDETLFALAFEPEAVVDFVGESILFEPYRGTLKGARGTLSARSGNALDQSLLLATLLNDSGAEARIARSRLGDDTALALAAAALDVVDLPALTLDQERFDNAVSAIAAEMGHSAPPMLEGEVEAARPAPEALAIASELQQMVSITPATDALLETIKDYFFVEWRIGPGDPWIQAHPSFGTQPPPEAIQPDEYFGSSIPEDLQHRIRFEIGIEKLESGRLVRQSITSPWERPAANFFDASVTWGIMPLDRQAAGSDDPTRVFVPTFGGQLAPGAQGFNLLGQTLDPRDAANPAAGVIATVGNRFLDAASGIADNPDDQPLMALTGQYIQVTWVRPDRTTRTEERWFLDRVANRDEQNATPRIDSSITDTQITESLYFQRTYLVQPAGLHLPWTLKRSLEATASRLSWSADLLGMLDWEEARLDLNPRTLDDWTNDQPVLLQLAALVHHPLELDESQTTWRDGPFVVALHQSAPDPENPRVWMDINFNPWRGLQIEEGTIRDRPDLAVLRGVLDTFWEGSIAGKPDAYRTPIGERINAPSSLRQSLDMEQGFALASIESNATEPMWWRVHPETGEVLGMQNIGGGVEFEEYLGIVMIGITGVLILRSMWNCNEMEDASRRRCCYAVAVVFGISSGAGIGASLMASPIGMTVGAAAAMGVLQLNAMLTLDYAQGLATEAACD